MKYDIPGMGVDVYCSDYDPLKDDWFPAYYHNLNWRDEDDFMRYMREERETVAFSWFANGYCYGKNKEAALKCWCKMNNVRYNPDPLPYFHHTPCSSDSMYALWYDTNEYYGEW